MLVFMPPGGPQYQRKCQAGEVVCWNPSRNFRCACGPHGNGCHGHRRHHHRHHHRPQNGPLKLTQCWSTRHRGNPQAADVAKMRYPPLSVQFHSIAMGPRHGCGLVQLDPDQSCCEYNQTHLKLVSDFDAVKKQPLKSDQIR